MRSRGCASGLCVGNGWPLTTAGTACHLVRCIGCANARRLRATGQNATKEAIDGGRCLNGLAVTDSWPFIDPASSFVRGFWSMRPLGCCAYVGAPDAHSLFVVVCTITHIAWAEAHLDVCKCAMLYLSNRIGLSRRIDPSCRMVGIGLRTRESLGLERDRCGS